MSDARALPRRSCSGGAVAAGATALLAASKTARILVLAGAAGYGVWKLRNSKHDPWQDVEPPRAR
jgi:hypothetical protein